MAKHLVISTSGNRDSNSRRMGRVAFAHLQKQKVDCDWIDIFAYDFLRIARRRKSRLALLTHLTNEF